MSSERGLLLVVSAPSGAGKHTILRELLRADPNVEYSISATTRLPRAGERDGVDYYFLDRAEFVRRIEVGAFAEWAEVHGNLYGTLRVELDRRLDSGKDVVLEIDVQGMRNLRGMFPEAVTVFIAPPSCAALETRLRGRGANSDDDIALRLRNARVEMAACREYDYVVVNDVIEQAVGNMCAIVRAERVRARRYSGPPEDAPSE